MRTSQIILLVAAAFGLIGMGVLIWVRYPDNHGAGSTPFRWFFAFLLLAAAVLWMFAGKAPVPVLVLALLGLAATWIVDSRNIMVDYDDWIHRGMPEWGTVTRPPSEDGARRRKGLGARD